MENITSIFSSSIGKKFLMGITGLFLCTFLVVHLLGNFLLFKNDGGLAFNAYSEFMSTNILIRAIEIVLFLGLFGHAIIGVILWIQNKRARPQKYDVTKPQENSSLSSRVMFFTGSIVFIFLVVHLRTFWVPARFYHADNPSMYELVVSAFRSPVYCIFYVIAMGLLAFHLHHGFQSAFQTFGLKHKKYAALIEGIGIIFWLLFPVGFASMPIYFLLFL